MRDRLINVAIREIRPKLCRPGRVTRIYSHWRLCRRITRFIFGFLIQDKYLNMKLVRPKSKGSRNFNTMVQNHRVLIPDGVV